MHFLNSSFNSFQNDMGLKPHDCAKVMGQKECAEFLLLYETSLEMAKELSEVHTKREVLMAEHNELRSYFKYVHTGSFILGWHSLKACISKKDCHMIKNRTCACSLDKGICFFTFRMDFELKG